MYGEILVPGDAIYTKIIPVYDGELSTKHLAFYVEDHGLDPNAPNSCDLIASSTSGSPIVPPEAKQCHYSNTKTGPYSINCVAEGDYGSCKMVRSVKTGTATVTDSKIFYVNGIDRVSVLQSLDDSDDDILTLSSIDTFSKPTTHGGLFLFVKYNGDYFDLKKDALTIKDGGTRVIGYKEITEKYNNPTVNGKPIYASGYSSIEYCKEHGYDYVKSYRISSSKAYSIGYIPGVGWNKQDNYYYFTQIECGKLEVQTEKVDTYAGTNNQIAYGINHLQYFDGLGKKVLEIKGNPEYIKEFAPYIQLTGVDVYNKTVTDDTIKFVFQEKSGVYYGIKFIEPPKQAYGEFYVKIYPEAIPEFYEDFDLVWVVGPVKKLSGYNVLIGQNINNSYAIAPADQVEKIKFSGFEASKAVPYISKNINAIKVDTLSGYPINIQVTSDTDPYFPHYLIPGDELKVRWALYKEFGTSSSALATVYVKTVDGDVITKKVVNMTLNFGHNEYNTTITLPEFTESGNTWYGKGVMVEVDNMIPDNIYGEQKITKSGMDADAPNVGFKTMPNGKLIMVIPDNQVLDVGDTINYQFDLFRGSKRLSRTANLHFEVVTSDGHEVSSWNRIYSLREGDNYVSEVYTIPKKDKDGYSLIGKDLKMIVTINVPYNMNPNTKAIYEWIRLKSYYHTIPLGYEIFMNKKDFEEWLNNKFKTNTIEKSLYMASYNDYLIEQYLKDPSVTKITLTISVPNGLPNNAYNEIYNIVRGEPGVSMSGNTITFTIYEKGKDYTSVYNTLLAVRGVLAKYKVYWEEDLKVAKEKQTKIIKDLI